MFSVRILLIALDTGWFSLVKAELLFGFSLVFTKENHGPVVGRQPEKILRSAVGKI